MTATAFHGLDACVHCGFCLQSCPTFLVTGDEADSPRGRIVLMQALAADRLGPRDADLRLHLDRCLGCRACEPACPSGVAYGPALEAARERLAAARPIPPVARAVHAVMGEPWLRSPLLALARAARPVAGRLAGHSRAGFAMGMLAATTPQPAPTAASEQRERRSAFAPSPTPSPVPSPVTLLRGCIMDGLFAHVHAATERVLRANGYEVVAVEDQGCCGALHAHAGQHDAAEQLARRNVAAFSRRPDAHIAVNSAGCGALMKEYGRVCNGAAQAAAATVASRVRDVSELLAERGPRRGAPLALRVAYDPPCHLLHAQRVQDPPEAMLDAVPGLTRVRHAEADLCCGSAGSYSLVEPEMSRAVLGRKVEALLHGAPDVVATGNPGCVMHIGAGLRAAGRNIPVVHPIEILDWSYRQAGYYDD